MELKFLLLTCSLCSAIYSCQLSSMTKGLESTAADIRLAESMATDFFFQLRFGEKQKLLSVYPGLQHFDSYYKSEGIAIKSATENNGQFTVLALNKYKNEKGGLEQKKVSLYFRKDAKGNLLLVDSKGVFNFEKMDEYTFATKTGCIDSRSDTTDQQVVKGIRKARLMMPEKALAIYKDLKEGLQVVEWNWQPGFDGSAFGEGMVINASSLVVPQLKYKITYSSNRGDTLCLDTGYVSYDPLFAGDSTSFTFYTANASKAANASLEFLLDDELVFRYLASRIWTGKECSEYFRQYPQKLKDL